MKNSREKGARGEREFARLLREHYTVDARRGVQYKGGPDSPDVEGIPGIHFEVKRTERLSLYEAMAQAERDCGDRVPVVAHRRNGKEWLLIIREKDVNRFIESMSKVV